MADRLRRSRTLLVPCVCGALVVALLQFSTAANGREVGQFDRITVNPTVSEFVRPVSPSGLFELYAMSQFARLLEPESQLPESGWLLDDSEPPALACHESDPLVGELAEEIHGDWIIVVRIILRTTPQTRRYITTVTTITLFEEEENAQADAQAAAFQQEVDANATNLAADEEEMVIMVNNVAEEIATDDFEAAAALVAEAYGYENTIGEARNEAQVRELIAAKRRELMLSYELDALVLGAL